MRASIVEDVDIAGVTMDSFAMLGHDKRLTECRKLLPKVHFVQLKSLSFECPIT